MPSAGKSSRPTLQTVADLAGTSAAVVSYVINDGPRNVAPATKSRVLDAIAASGYRPNRLARALATQKSRTLGLIVPDTTNAFFRDLSQALQRAAFERDHLMLIGNAALDKEHERSYLAAFLDANVDGLIVASNSLDMLGPAVVPPSTQLVALNTRLQPDGLSVFAADRVGAAEVTSHLLDHCPSSVWCLTGHDPDGALDDRLLGWRDALQAGGLTPNPDHIVRSLPIAADASVVMQQVLARPDRPSAVFVATDEQAIGVIHAAYQLGLSVPGDLAVASFDGTSAGQTTAPPLTTAQVPMADMAAAAVDLAINDQPAARQIQLPVELVVRGSCGCS